MHLWQHLLNNIAFDVCVDHISIINIVKAKTLPISQRIIRLLDLLSKFKFSLYYDKGKDMILADFLSRIAIPISFDCVTTPKNHFNEFLNKFLTARRKTSKELGIKLPEVPGISKILNPHKKPKHQKPSLSFLKNQILIP